MDPAIEAYREMADVDPALASRSSAQVIDAYRSAKDFAKAQQEADAAVKKWPDDRLIRTTRDSLLAEMGKVDAAASDLKKLLDGKADDRDTYIALANIYDKGQRWNDMGKARDAAEKLSSSYDDKEGLRFT